MDGTDYYVLTAAAAALKPEVDVLRHYVDLFSQQTLVTLELAATYDAFRQMGLSHDESLSRLRAKKGEKCAGGREAMAIELLGRVHLPEAV